MQNSILNFALCDDNFVQNRLFATRIDVCACPQVRVLNFTPVHMTPKLLRIVGRYEGTE